MITEMKEFSLIPDFFKTKLSEDSIIEKKDENSGTAVYFVPFSVKDGKYTYNNLFNKVYQNICWYFNSYSELKNKVKGYPSALDFLKKFDLPRAKKFSYSKETGYYGKEYISGVNFLSKDDANTFVNDLNLALSHDYKDLEAQLKVSLFLSNSNIDRLTSKPEDVIVGTKHLSSYFSGEFKSKYFFRTMKIVEVLNESPLALELKVRIHTEISGQCHICGKSLTDSFSQVTGIGPVCAKKYLNVKNGSVEETIRKIKEIAESYGVIGPVVVPKSQIRKI